MDNNARIELGTEGIEESVKKAVKEAIKEGTGKGVFGEFVDEQEADKSWE